eukprot:m.151424 g.151424  ORF g.151424 m.151424 type:complete len:812 (-) comp30759_c4_seq2:133-2568(-)
MTMSTPMKATIEIVFSSFVLVFFFFFLQSTIMASSAGLRNRKGTDSSTSSGGSKVSMDKVSELKKNGRVAMVIDNVAYDFTDFANNHPGGAEYLKKNAGFVATAEFIASHPVDIIERTLTATELQTMTIGDVDQASITPAHIAKYESKAEGAVVNPNEGNKPTLDSCINIYDFEAIASRTVPMTGWVYYSSGADDEITLRENHNAFHRIWMKPRVMINVKEINMKQTILGHECEMPMFLSAVAMCKLGHPEGETAWMKGAGEQGIIYMVPTLSGCSFTDIVNARKPDQPMFFQLYVNQDKDKVKAIVKKAEDAGCSALFITCDAPQLGNRERDRRVKVSHSGANVQKGASGPASQGTSKALTTFIDPSLNWSDLKWFKSITNMKIVLKGVGTKEDAIMALEHGMAGVLLSNHGGRQLDFARSAIEVLPEVMAALKAHPKYDPATFEVFIDGGIRRGTDLFKALALGAKAVGVGRPALYAMSAFGAAGVSKMIQILKDELFMTMRLMGTPSIADIKPEMVDTSFLNHHISMVPMDMLQRETYIPPVSQAVANHYKRFDAAEAEAKQLESESKSSTSTVELSTSVVATKLVQETIMAIAKTVVTTDPRLSVHRTAMFLIVFLVIHLLGNLSIFLGPDALNAYAHHLHTGVIGSILKVVEFYLAAAFVLHAAVSMFLTLKYKKLVPAKSQKSWLEYPTGNAKLALTGTVISAFLVVHVLQFRWKRPESVGDVHGDIHTIVVDTLRSTPMYAFYVVSLVLIGAHLRTGWVKTINKMDFTGTSKELKKPVTDLGSTLVLFLIFGFIAVATKAHLSA